MLSTLGKSYNIPIIILYPRSVPVETVIGAGVSQAVVDHGEVVRRLGHTLSCAL